MFKNKIWILAVAILLVTAFTGCSLVQVNPERDQQQVIAEINGEDMLKLPFLQYMAYLEMYYDMYDYTFPEEGSELEELKIEVVDDLVQMKVLEDVAEEEEKTVDEESIEEEVTSALDSLKEGMGGEDKYIAFLESKSLDPDEFETFFTEYMTMVDLSDQVYTDISTELIENPDEVADDVILTVNGEEVTRDTYNYYYLKQNLNYYMTMGEELASDDESMIETNETIYDEIASAMLITEYAAEQGIEITDEEIEEEVATIDSYFSLYLGSDEDTINAYIESIYITPENFETLKEAEAIANISEAKVQESLEEGVEVTESDIENYFNDNIDSYNTVSAMHILTDDEEQAQAIYEEAEGATQEEFEAMVAEYDGADGILEASDLGAFTYETMVESFSEAAFALDVGEVTGPVETDYGYHVIFVYDKEESTLEDESEEIEATLIDEEVTTQYNNLITGLTDGASIEADELVTDPVDAEIDALEETAGVKIYYERL
jgi:foldase protein PrsA